MENPFEEINERLKGIEKKLNNLLSRENVSENKEELLTRDQTCELLSINSSTLWHWTNKAKVKAYGIGGKRYYKRSELIEEMVQLNKIPDASEYLIKPKGR